MVLRQYFRTRLGPVKNHPCMLTTLGCLQNPGPRNSSVDSLLSWVIRRLQNCHRGGLQDTSWHPRPPWRPWSPRRPWRPRRFRRPPASPGVLGIPWRPWWPWRLASLASRAPCGAIPQNWGPPWAEPTGMVGFSSGMPQFRDSIISGICLHRNALGQRFRASKVVASPIDSTVVFKLITGQRLFLGRINFQLQIQNRAARRINFHYRDRSLGISAENLSLQIQIPSWIPINIHYRYRFRAQNEVIL